MSQHESNPPTQWRVNPMTSSNTPLPYTWYAEDSEQTTARLHRIRHEPPPTATIGRGLVYPGQITTCFGEPDAGKSLLAAAIGAEEANNGISTLWIDFEQGPDRTLRRLSDFGATDHTLTTSLDRIHYPMGTPPAELFQAFEGIQLVIIDALTGLLTAMGLSSNSDTDIETAYALALRPFAALGAGVFVIDHVVKNKETQGRWATGSQRKIGAADVALRFDSITRFRIGNGGRAKITVSRDRDGAVQPSIFTLDGNMTWNINTDAAATSNTEEFRPTGLMEKISRYLEVQTAGASGKSVIDDVSGKTDWKRKALVMLVNEGYVETNPGKYNATIYTSQKVYREADEPLVSPARPSSPQVSPGTARPSSPQFAPPYVVGEGESRGPVAPNGRPSPQPSSPLEYAPPDEAYYDPEEYIDNDTSIGHPDEPTSPASKEPNT